MPRLLPALLCVLALTACAVSRPMPPRSASPPRIPQMAAIPCARTPIQAGAEGALSAAAAEQALRARDIDLARCEARRRAAAEAWPQ